MKTTISLPDQLCQAADRLAAQLGTSRSALFARAVAEYLERYRFQEVTERLDAVYAGDPDASELTVSFGRQQIRSLAREDW